jgi:ABC-type multidrug transport system fused ATPase/permease subunit
MGDPEHAWDEDRVRQAAELSGASDIISNLSEGFDTVLSPPLDFYSGASEGRHKAKYERLKSFIGRAQDPKLSGGQMQKLALYVLLYGVLLVLECLNIVLVPS